jgi:hypothetical protein
LQDSIILQDLQDLRDLQDLQDLRDLRDLRESYPVNRVKKRKQHVYPVNPENPVNRVKKYMVCEIAQKLNFFRFRNVLYFNCLQNGKIEKSKKCAVSHTICAKPHTF